MINADVKTFFEYLRSFHRRFFGNDLLTFPGFISIYLNYDTDYNPIRRAILNVSEKSNKDITVDCLNYVKNHLETDAQISDLSTDCLLGKSIKVSIKLDHVTRPLIHREDIKDIHDFMYILLCSTYKEYPESIMSYFMDVFEVDFEEVEKIAKGYLSELNENELYRLPDNVSEFARIINGKRDDYMLFMGDDFKDCIWDNMLKYSEHNIILVADYADMICCYVNNMAYEISHDVSCASRRDKVVIEVDMQRVVQFAVTDEECINALQRAVKNLLNLLKKEKIILYLKNYNVLFRNGGNGFSYLFYTFPLFQDKDLRIILDLSEEEFNVIRSNNRFMELVEALIFDEPSKDEIAEYLRGYNHKLITYHGVYVDSSKIEIALRYVKALQYGGSVNGTRSLLDFSMGYANSIGKNEISVDDFIESFKISFHAYEKHSSSYKNLVAYHEAGHFVVSRFCEHFKSIYSDLVSIISTSDAGGMNILEEDESVFESNDYDFYLEWLAMSLAGRASEELFLEKVSAGAVSDLEQATEIATAMISNYGLDKNKKIKGNENLKSEKSINEVSEKVDVYIEEAYDTALRILEEHEEYVHSLVKLLFKEKIVSREKILSFEYEEDGQVLLKVD